MSEDFYDILGVGRDADEDEIQQAYRKKASEFHPDVSDDPDAEEKFKKAKKAKEVLSDPEKRQAYDRLGHERFEEAEKRGGFDGGRGGAAGQGPFAGGGFGGGGAGGQGFGSVEDIFEQFFGGGSGRGGSRRRQGSDLRTDISIDLSEAYHGVEKEITVERPQQCEDCNGEGHPPDSSSRTCPECDGRGQVREVQQTPFGRVQQTGTCRRCEGAGEIFSETCGTCGGDGVVREEATLAVEIPAGIQDGQTLRMEGEGAPSPEGGRNGDLLIDVSVADHPELERDGDDLYYTAEVSFPQVVFGDEISVPTVDGETEVEVPAGTQSGAEFRVRNEGMPRLRRRGSGDLHVEIQVRTPEELTDEQKEALVQFAEASGEDVDVDEGFIERIASSF